jgi:hypothetical protein
MSNRQMDGSREATFLVFWDWRLSKTPDFLARKGPSGFADPDMRVAANSSRRDGRQSGQSGNEP